MKSAIVGSKESVSPERRADFSQFLVDTERTYWTGMLRYLRDELGVKLAIGETRLGWATVALVSHDAAGFGGDGKPARILLAATALSHNKGAKFTKGADGVSISCRGKDWGRGGVVNEGVPLAVTLPAKADAVRCWALDERGERKAEVPVGADANGCAGVSVGPAYRTVWYELVVK